MEVTTSIEIGYQAENPIKFGEHDVTGPNASLGMNTNFGPGSEAIGDFGMATSNGNNQNQFSATEGTANDGMQGMGEMAMFDISPSQGFDIASFSFDTDAMIQLLGGEQYFDGSQYGWAGLRQKTQLEE